MTPVEDAAPGSPRHPSGRSWWRTAVQWRNWPLLVKLAAVLIVPIVVVVALSVLRLSADIKLSESYADVEKAAALRDELVPTLSVLQRERLLGVQLVLGSPENPQAGAAQNNRTNTADSRRAAFEQQTRSVDVITAQLVRMISETPNLSEAATASTRELTDALGTLGKLRQQVLSGADAGTVTTGYSAVIKEALDFDRTLSSQFQEQALTGTSAALYDLQVAREQVSLQQVILLPALRRGDVQDGEREALVEADIRLADKLADCQEVAPPALWQRYRQTVAGPSVDIRDGLVTIARSDRTNTTGTATQTSGTTGRNKAKAAPQAMPVSESDWNSSSDTVTGLQANVARGAAADLRSIAGGLQDTLSNQAGAESVLLLATILLAAAVGGVLGRYLLRSVGLLRRTALDVASNRLPTVVANIREGRTANVTIDPVPLRTTEEFGQLARAFDAVNEQAVRSAAEEAALRSNLRNIFVNLSRRSQGLVERQLRLVEQLEHNEDDPDQLANLFKLDHLATRMRRNNENLMVLSGIELGRRFTEALPLPDVLRAAVSEVEQYHRAVVQSVPLVDIVGYAAGDLTRLVAELVENATSFSPPVTQVMITGRRQEDGQVLVEILDKGIGMGEAELREANSRVAAGGSVDVPISRQMGLFVVGTLAARHGIRVTLSKREEDEGGLRAAVLVPAELVVTKQDEDSTADAPAKPASPAEPAADSTAGERADAETTVVSGHLGGSSPAVAPTPGAEPLPAPQSAPESAPELVPAGAATTAGAPADEVATRLRSAGIFVELKEFPDATSPASILFAARTEADSNGSAGTASEGLGANGSGSRRGSTAGSTAGSTEATVWFTRPGAAGERSTGDGGSAAKRPAESKKEFKWLGGARKPGNGEGAHPSSTQPAPTPSAATQSAAAQPASNQPASARHTAAEPAPAVPSRRPESAETPAAAAESAPQAGLPKRVPRAQLLGAQARPAPSAAKVAASRDAHQVRGLLSSFQAGIRQSRPATGEQEGDGQVRESTQAGPSTGDTRGKEQQGEEGS